MWSGSRRSSLIRLEAPPLEVPEPMIDFGQVGHTEAFEDVQHLAAVLRVVEGDVEDGAAERHGPVEVVNEGVVQALLVAHPAREGREGRVGALVAFAQRGQ